MSTLQVANLHFETTGANRIEYTGNNVVRVRANGGFQLPFGTSAQRANGDVGLIRYNTDTGLVESFGGAGTWDALPAGPVFNVAYGVANAAFARANTALQNTSGTFAGTLTVSGAALNVVGGANPYLSLNDGTNGTSYLQIAAGVTNLYGGGSQPVSFSTNGTTRVLIDATGSVGIGTTTPNTQLEIRRSVSNYWNPSTGTFTGRPQALTITNTTGGGYDPVVMFRQTDQGGTVQDSGAIGLVGTNNWAANTPANQTSDMYFLVRNNSGGISERMRLTSSGGLIVGASSYSATNNSISLQNGRIMMTKNDDWGIEMAGANGTRIRFYSSVGGQSSTVGSVQVDGTSAYYYTGNLYVYRQGIKFPATQESSADANTLDDYEEGTWTGTLNMHSNPADTSGTNTTLNSTGRYTKIGDMVYITIYFDVQGYSNHVAKSISGLPFTSANIPEQGISLGHTRGIRFVYSTSITNDMTLSASVATNSTSISLAASSASSAFSGWWYISNEPAQGKYIPVSGCYKTA